VVGSLPRLVLGEVELGIRLSFDYFRYHPWLQNRIATRGSWVHVF